MALKSLIRKGKPNMRAVGDRVMLTRTAFDNGVYERNTSTMAYRGTVLREARGFPGCWVVKWDHKKTPERLDQSFITKETNAGYR